MTTALDNENNTTHEKHQSIHQSITVVLAIFSRLYRDTLVDLAIVLFY